jgi:hypothetical protein
MFFVPAIAAVSTVKFHRHSTNLGWCLLATFYVFIVGFRFQVGIDWFNLLTPFLHGMSDGGLTVKAVDIPLVTPKGEVGHGLLIWISAKIGVGIYGVNLAGATVFIGGLFAFCRRQPAPSLALVIAVPILVIVIGMGYNRQAMAISFLLLAIISLSDERVLRFVILIALGSLFHATVLLFIPIGLIAYNTKSIWRLKYFWKFIWLSLIGTILFYSLLEEYLFIIKNYYYGIKMTSAGAVPRLLLNVLPAIIFLMLRKRFNLNLVELRLWTCMSVISIIFLPMIAVLPSSSAVDRLGFYLIPIQLFVFSRLPFLFQQGFNRQTLTAFIIMGYAILQFTFLIYGTHAHGWIPYKNYLWETFY